MPEAAVIPYPIANIKFFAVKKLVVGLLVGTIGPTLCVGTPIFFHHPWVDPVWHHVVRKGIPIVYCEKLEFSKQYYAIEYISMK